MWSHSPAFYFANADAIVARDDDVIVRHPQPRWCRC
jgi:hypothetical protein